MCNLVFTKSGSNPVTITSFQTDKSSSEFDHVKLRNSADDAPSNGINDLTVLTHLHEPAILYCLQNRYTQKIVYTNTGPILIAVNPFERLQIYSQSTVREYQVLGESKSSKSSVTLPPHVFQIADNAYRNMVSSLQANSQQGTNQSILVSGESGAGKTETTKFIMQYLADIVQEKKVGVETNTKSIPGVEEQMLQSNPILESFGNARTLRNDNSSRFGKFIEMGFSTKDDFKLSICGAVIRTYLLEKVRLVFQSSGERNYHCFYELIRGSSQERRSYLGLTEIEDFYYINQSGCDQRQDGVDDGAQYNSLVAAMQVLNFSKEEQESALNTVAGVLHIGNLKFREDNKGGELGEGCCFSDACSSNVHFVCKLLGWERPLLESSLCEKFVKAKDDSYTKRFSVVEAESNRDSLAKIIYGALFDWLGKYKLKLNAFIILYNNNL